MKEQKEKYESPFMERSFVELEGSFCSSNGAKGTEIVTSGTKVDIHEQESFEDIDMSGMNSNDAWK